MLCKNVLNTHFELNKPDEHVFKWKLILVYLLYVALKNRNE